MLFTLNKMNRFICLLIYFHCLNFCDTQLSERPFRASNVEIIPSSVVIDSTSVTDFICINYESNNSRLIVNTSGLIPTNEIKISKELLNDSAIRIRVESQNYVGIFHLICYSNDAPKRGNRADVIVKDAPGILQLAEKCRVYDRQYIKCRILAPIIAKAIQNGYDPRIEFTETSYPSDRKVYGTAKFLSNESTSADLVFIWRPMREGQFPNGFRMNMTQMLQHFKPSSYIFDMTPIFDIKPKFTVEVKSSSEIAIKLMPIPSPIFCEKTIRSELNSNNNSIWTVIEPERNAISFNNLISNSVYNVCIRCRQVYNDPEGTEECQKVQTLPNWTLYWIGIPIPIGIVLLLIVGIIIWLLYKKWSYKPVLRKLNGQLTNRSSSIELPSTLNRYGSEPSRQPSVHNPPENDDPVSHPLMIDNDHDRQSLPNSDATGQRIASSRSLERVCGPEYIPMSDIFDP